MNKDGVRYTLAFATAVCVVCALMVAVAAVALKPTQDAQARLFMQKNVLLAAGLLQPGQAATAAEQAALFTRHVEARLLDLRSHRLLRADEADALNYDQRRARADEAQSRAAPANTAGVVRQPYLSLVYFVRPQGPGTPVQQVVLPIEGLAMWGTAYGFIALATDGNTVTGLAFYEQKETPGLGGEISNPKWQALWRGRKVFDPDDAAWTPKLAVIKGSAGPAERDPHRVDGISGSTITSNAITRLVQFWMSEAGYGRWLREFRASALTPGAPA